MDRANNGDYDLVLMDVQMPVMGGDEATKWIRKDHRLKGLPIIAMTAHATKGYREKCIEIGMNDYCYRSRLEKHFLSPLRLALLVAHGGSARAAAELAGG